MKKKKILITLAIISFICLSVTLITNKVDTSNLKIGDYFADNIATPKSDVSVDVINNPKIDIMVTQKDSDLDMTNFDNDVIARLEDYGIDTTNVRIQTVKRNILSTNSTDASVIFNQWGRIGWAGQWSIVKTNNINTIQNAENTDNYTGFYCPDNYEYTDIEMEFDNRTTNADDDFMGCMFRFNLTADSTNTKNKTCTTYIFALDKHDNGGGISNGQYNGLLKITNSTFEHAKVERLATVPRVTWTRNTWAHYKIAVKGNNIKIYQNNNLIIDYTDTSATAIKSGSYGLFSYSQPYAQFRNFQVVAQDTKAFKDVLLEPSWREDAYHIVVNVDNTIDDTLTGTETIGEILSRTLNDNLHLVQWGSEVNKTAIEDFITKNDNKGIFTSGDNYENAVDKTAQYIKSLIENSGASQYVIVGEDSNLQVTPESLKTGAISEDFPNGRWMIHHNYTYFANNLGQSANTEVYTPDLMCTFDKPGEYKLYFDDDLVKTVYAHRRPIADFSIDISNSTVNVESSSFDLDSNEDIGYGKGIKEEKWYYKKPNDSTWTEGKLTSYDKNEIYVIKLEVTDFQECTSYTTKYIGIGNPVASFNYGASTITKYQDLVINDTSYDPAGYDITGWEWTLRKGSVIIGTYKSQVPSVLNFNVANLGTGNYTYALAVTNSQGIKSEVYTKAFTVIDDTDAPEVIIDPTYCDWKQSQLVNFTFSDADSGLLHWRYSLDQNQEISDETEWSDYITDLTYQLNIEEEGQHYIHVQAYDNAGNLLQRTVGVYKIDRTKPEGEADIVQPTEELKAAVINITATDDASGVAKIIFPNGGESTGANASYNVTTPGDYTFTIVDNAGNEREIVVPVEILSLGVEVRYIDQVTGDEISTTTLLRGNMGQTYNTIAKTIEGYELVVTPENYTGEYALDKTIVTYEYRKNAYVKTRYINENNGYVLSSQVDRKYKEGDTYTTEKLDIEGYTFTRLDGEATGTVGREDITVTYYYKKNTSVTVKYVDMLDNNKEITEKVVIDGLQNDDYETEEKEIPGYIFVEVEGIANGKMGYDPSEVIYKYKKGSNLITEHRDANTNERIVEDVLKTYKEGDAYEAYAQSIPGYVLVQEPETKTGVMGREDVTKTFYYKKMSDGLVVRYVDKISNEVLDRIVYEGNENDTITLEEKSFLGYVLDERPESNTVTLGTTAKEVTFYYKKTMKINVIGIDQQTGEELYKTTMSGIEGDPYKTTARNVDQYELVRTPNNNIGTYDRNDTKVIYEYRKKAERVVVKYIDQETNTELDSYIIEGTAGQNYQTDKKSFENYKLVEIVGNEAGILTNVSQEVIYYYQKTTGKVVVRYVTEEGNELLKEELIGKSGENYSVTIKEVPGYRQIRVEGETTGKYTTETKVITVTLEREEPIVEVGKVIVKYLDQNNNEVLREELVGKIGENYSVIIKEVPNYKQVSIEGETEGQYATEIKEVIVRLEKEEKPAETGKVTVKYIDQNNREIRKEEYSGIVGADYNIKIKEILGYKQVSVEGETTGKYTTEEKEVVVRLEKEEEPIEKGKVVVRYIDQDGKEISKDEIVGNVGEDYTVTIKEVSGYKQISVEGETTGKYTTETKEVIVRVEKERTPEETGNVIVTYIDQNNKQVHREEYEGTIGEDYEVTIKEIPGYRQISVEGETTGKYTTETKEVIVRLEKEEEPIETGKVVVKYIDQYNNEVLKEELSGDVGLDYEVTIKEIPGYKQVSVEGETTGKYTTETKEVIVRLEKEGTPVETGKVIVKYVDQDNKEVLKEELTGTVGTDYNVTVKEVPGYKQVSVEGETTGKYTTETKEVIVRLEKEEEPIETGKVVVKYIDQDNNEISKEELTGTIGTDYNVTIKEIPGYKQISVEGETTGKYTIDTKEVIVRVEREEIPVETGKVTVRYIDQNNNEIRREELTGTIGLDYKVVVKEISGYKIVEVTGETSGKYEVEEKEVIVKLEKEQASQETGKVTVKYIDQDNNILRNEQYTGTVGLDYKITVKEISGYKIVEVTGETSGQYEIEEKEIIVRLEKEEEVPGETGNIIVKYIDQNNNEVRREEYTGTVGLDYKVIIKEISGYKQISVEGETEGQYATETKEIIVRLEKEVVVVKTGNVVVKYIDQDNNEVRREEYTGVVGNDYNVIVKEVPGYKQIGVEGETRGQYEEDTKEIIVRLEREEVVVKTGNVVVKYIDEDNNEIRREEYTGVVGNDYNVTIKEISGYKQVSVEGETTGKYEEDTKEIIVKLEKEEIPVETGKVTVKYVDQNGKEISKDEMIGNVGEDYKVTVKDVPGYKLVSVEGKTEGQYAKEEQEVIVILEKEETPVETGKVIVKYIDQDGKEVIKEELTGNVGEEYKVTVKEISGYKVVEVTGKTEGQYAKEEQEVIVRLEKEEIPVETGKVTVKYVDQDGKEISKDEMIGNVGEDYKVTVKEIPGYKLVDVTGETTGKYTGEEKEVIVRLEKEETPVETGKVVVKYVDQDGKEILKEELIGKVGEDYKVTVKDLSGYDIVEIPGNTTGKYGDGTIEVIIKVVDSKIKPVNKGTIVVKHIDENGNIIKEDYIENGEIGKYFSYEVPEIEGYKRVGEEKIKAQFVDGRLVFEAKYEKVPENNTGNTDPEENKPFDLPNTGDINVILFTSIAILSLVLIKKNIKNVISK